MLDRPNILLPSPSRMKIIPLLRNLLSSYSPRLQPDRVCILKTHPSVMVTSTSIRLGQLNMGPFLFSFNLSPVIAVIPFLPGVNLYNCLVWTGSIEYGCVRTLECEIGGRQVKQNRISLSIRRSFRSRVIFNPTSRSILRVRDLRGRPISDMRR